MCSTDKEKLIRKAQNVRQNARAIYSGYKVGAAVLTSTGEIYTGCNIEISSYGLTTCAERNALSTAIAAGHHTFTMMVIITENGAPPCGACRQVIWEICGDIPLILVDNRGKKTVVQSTSLIPNPFDDRKLRPDDSSGEDTESEGISRI